jgi:hypothetical protein
MEPFVGVRRGRSVPGRKSLNGYLRVEASNPVVK